MKSAKGRPFLEIFASALNEDYRFPILEVFAFLFALATLVEARYGLSMLGGTTVTGVTCDSIAYSLVFSVGGGPSSYLRSSFSRISPMVWEATLRKE